MLLLRQLLKQGCLLVRTTSKVSWSVSIITLLTFTKTCVTDDHWNVPFVVAMYNPTLLSSFMTYRMFNKSKTTDATSGVEKLLTFPKHTSSFWLLVFFVDQRFCFLCSVVWSIVLTVLGLQASYNPFGIVKPFL